MFKPYLIAGFKTAGWRILPANEWHLCDTNAAVWLLAKIEDDQDENVFSLWRPRDTWLIKKAHKLGYGSLT